MSGNQQEFDVERQGAASAVAAHNCEGASCAVYVNETRVPVGDVDLYVRNEGGADATRYVEGQVISPYDTDGDGNEEDFIQLFGAATPDEQTSFDTIRVDVRDHHTEQLVPQFMGICTGVGNAPGEMERIWQFRARGPGQLLDRIPASASFIGAKQDVIIEQVVDYVAERLRERLPFTVSTVSDAAIEGLGGGQEPPAPGTPEYLARSLDPLDTTERLVTQQTFLADRHTLTDVLDWLTELTDTTYWFAPTGTGVYLYLTETPNTFTHTAHYLAGDSTDNVTHIIDNDALAELRPVNALIAVGGGKRSRRSVGQFARNQLPEKIVRAKARHETLYQRAGDSEFYGGGISKTDAQTKQEIEHTAKRRLAKAIEGASSGDMTTLLRAPIQPYDLIRAKPTCQESPATDLPPITYEVSRVHHEITAQGTPTTTLNVTLPVHDDEITIVESGWYDVGEVGLSPE
jgi:hypothetical protein